MPGFPGPAAQPGTTLAVSEARPARLPGENWPILSSARTAGRSLASAVRAEGEVLLDHVPPAAGTGCSVPVLDRAQGVVARRADQAANPSVQVTVIEHERTAGGLALRDEILPH